jgi:mannose-6-phosphate isomerase-like protein (cupin superfamily)
MTKRAIRCALAFAGVALAFGIPMAMSNPQKPAGAQTVATAAVQHVDQISVEKYPWGEIRWMMNSRIDAGSAQTFGIVQINAGQKNAPHSHPNCEEILYVLSGSCEHVIGDKKVTLHAGDLIRVPVGVRHQATVLGNQPLRAVISYSSGDRQVTNYGPAKE